MVTEVLEPLQLPLWIDLVAVGVGALAGAAVAVREDLDVVGGLLLAVAMGTGGGIVRDVLLGIAPVALTSNAYLPTAALTALIGFFFATLLQRVGGLILVLDALSIGMFTIVGVEKALLHGTTHPAAVFVGVCAAIAGGMLTDAILGRPAAVAHRGPWNATASIAGAAVYVVTDLLGAPTPVSEAVAFVVVVAMRLAAVRWGLRNPGPLDLTRGLRDGARPRGRKRSTPPA